MIHVFKQGGNWKDKNGDSYTIKAIHESKRSAFLDDGWFLSLEDAMAIELVAIPESGSDYEAELRAKIKELGGKPGGRSSIETLESQLAELKAKAE